ncbi:serine acetyltransferase [Lacinutrix sp. Bg11-31]|uniref:serine acetyltransferase n=1 Tax=Lacinutrix sp. Bg11-31 TaxID=2057808 RepID=UPI000C300545|nr:serine acetyltransferase [Lacinutrix sp. Bg11-31]AUC82069.1 hypothetical protein CW733_07995 [Lacinutrix sp. Bg11-31]
MVEFVSFLQAKVYKPKAIPDKVIHDAFEKTVKDVNYHLPTLSKKEIKQRIQSNANELAVFLFRLGNQLQTENYNDLTAQIHWLLKELCSCEIYFNNTIAEGFYIIHGQGTVIGSRNTIGKGFIIHQGCTIGHKKNREGTGVVIGDNVTLYCNASILGDLKIENNVTIGAHILVSTSIKSNSIVLKDETHKIKPIK